MNYRKSFILLGLLFLIVGCKPICPNLQGEWMTIDKVNPCKVVITENMIHEYRMYETKSYEYTITQDYLHITRLWISETHRDYTADCKYSYKGNTLVIHDFLPTLTETYNDLKLVKIVK